MWFLWGLLYILLLLHRNLGTRHVKIWFSVSLAQLHLPHRRQSCSTFTRLIFGRPDFWVFVFDFPAEELVRKNQSPLTFMRFERRDSTNWTEPTRLRSRRRHAEPGGTRSSFRSSMILVTRLIIDVYLGTSNSTLLSGYSGSLTSPQS